MKYLALDIGNVCLEIDQITIWKKLGITRPSPAMLQIAGLLETGFLPEKEAFRRFYELLPVPTADMEKMRKFFLDILVRPKPGMPELISSLPGRGIQPVFFSDISIPHLQKTRQLFAPAAEMPCGIYSCEVGAMKPDLLMFRAFEARFGKPFLYTDDRADLLDAAARHGWRTHRFNSAENLEKALFGK